MGRGLSRQQIGPLVPGAISRPVGVFVTGAAVFIGAVLFAKQFRKPAG